MYNYHAYIYLQQDFVVSRLLVAAAGPFEVGPLEKKS